MDTKADTKAAASTVTALTQTVAQKAQIVTGTYTGNGAATRTIGLGATPKAVLLFTADGKTFHPSTYSTYYGGLALPGNPAGTFVNRGSVLEIVTGGFKVRYSSESNNSTISSNAQNYVYHYIAFV